MRSFQALLSDFLIDYIPRRRGLSVNTVKSYRDCFVLLLTYLDEVHSIKPDRVEMKDIDRDCLESFLGWLSEVRHVGPSTVNNRLAALKSFAEYTSFTEPAYLEWSKQIRAIKFSKASHPAIEHLSIEGVKAIIDAAKQDLRALALISLLYESGARVSELCQAKRHDFLPGVPATIKVTGKGNKTRVVPLGIQVASIVSRYLGEYPAEDACAMFSNRDGQAITRAGAAWILSKYSKIAYELTPQHVPPKVHPHMLRHSKAVHMLEDGVNIVYIRDFLGHSSIATTEVYAKASVKAKQAAIEKASQQILEGTAYGKDKRSELMDWLRSIM